MRRRRVGANGGNGRYHDQPPSGGGLTFAASSGLLGNSPSLARREKGRQEHRDHPRALWDAGARGLLENPSMQEVGNTFGGDFPERTTHQTLLDLRNLPPCAEGPAPETD